MPKIYKLNPASQTPAKAAAESYKAPAPPKDGRVIGLDCHPDIFTAALLEGQTPHDARKVGSRQDLTLEELLQWSKKDLTPKDLIVMEAGGNSFAVCKRLRETGRRAIVLESCHVGKHAKSYADNDKMAATRIAMVYLAGNAPAVWVPDEATFSRRELLHAHRNAVAEHTAATNSFKSFLNGHAIRLGKRSLKEKSTRAWIRTRRSDWSELEKCLIEDHFKHIDYTDKRRKELLLQITMQVEADPMMLRCMKLLGIGIVNAFALMAIIGDIRRFENPRKLVAYVGLNPGKRTSGTYKDVKVEVGGRGRGDLRYLLVQGAQAVLRMGKATAMGQWGWRNKGQVISTSGRQGKAKNFSIRVRFQEGFPGPYGAESNREGRRLCGTINGPLESGEQGLVASTVQINLASAAQLHLEQQNCQETQAPRLPGSQADGIYPMGFTRSERMTYSPLALIPFNGRAPSLRLEPNHCRRE